jgi:uncharacterized RmlC-like cupin family protein
VSAFAQFERDGHAGPVRVFSKQESASLLAALKAERTRPAYWSKGWAVSSTAYYRMGSDPRILDLVRQVLGEDFVLWGASLIVKRDNQVHPFHTDAETSGPDGGYVTVWIGLENTNRGSGLKFVSGSHRYGVTVQEENQRRGIKRGESSDETTLAAAREHDPDARIEQPAVDVGDALLFDGRTWHGSHNVTTDTRSAILLQYARADRAVHAPANYSSGPIRFKQNERPPVLAVSGRSPIGMNKYAVRPGKVPSAAYPIPPAPETAMRDWAMQAHMLGDTPVLDWIEVHSSVLAPGATPHALRHHIDEELVVIMDGEVELHTASNFEGTDLKRTLMKPGDFAYYPAFLWHTLLNTSDAPVLYTVYRWRNYGTGDTKRGGDGTFIHASEQLAQTPEPGKSLRPTLMELPTRWLTRLHAHASVVSPGAGYAPHDDEYDVGLCLISGAVETLGQTVSAPAFIYYPAHEPHGLRAVGDAPARYLTFEFDQRRVSLGRRIARSLKRGVKSLKKRLRRHR